MLMNEKYLLHWWIKDTEISSLIKEMKIQEQELESAYSFEINEENDGPDYGSQMIAPLIR